MSSDNHGDHDGDGDNDEDDCDDEDDGNGVHDVDDNGQTLFQPHFFNFMWSSAKKNYSASNLIF